MVCLQILSLSGTDPFPLAASLLLESFLPEFLRRAAAFWGSSFLRRLVVSCTEKCMTSISRQSQHCVTDTVYFFIFYFLKECHNLDFFLEELEHPLPEVVSQVLYITVVKLIWNFSSITLKTNTMLRFALCSMSVLLTQRHVYSRLVENNVTPSHAELLVFLMSAALCEVQWKIYIFYYWT